MKLKLFIFNVDVCIGSSHNKIIPFVGFVTQKI